MFLIGGKNSIVFKITKLNKSNLKKIKFSFRFDILESVRSPIRRTNNLKLERESHVCKI